MSSRPLRADAVQNREAIIAAARRVFAARGSSAPLEEIAREAAVGIATLYRRFTTRDELLEAVFAEKMAQYVSRSVEAAELARTEPWQALSGYLLFVLEAQADDPAFTEVLVAPFTGSALFADERRSYLRSTLTLVKRAKSAGVVRPDFDHTDLFLAVSANAGLVRTAPDAWRRLGAYLLEGFRAPGSEPLPPVAASWRRNDTD